MWGKTLTITREQLTAALREWELSARLGRLRSDEERVSLPLDQCAEEAAEYLWSLLQEG